MLRKSFAYGDEENYFADQDLIGWVRHGEEEHPEKMAVVISLFEKKTIRMALGDEYAGKVFADYTGNCEDKVEIDEEGFGDFPAEKASISVWLRDGLELV